MKKLLAFLFPLVFATVSAQAQEAGDGAAGVNRLTLGLAKAVIARQQDPADNIIISPYNALTALSLAAIGSGGATRDEFAKALYGSESAKLDDNVTAFTQLNKTILDANKGHVDLLTASGIWVNQDIATIKPGYAALAKENFGAAISDEDFGDKKTVDKINQWASDKTKGLIDKVLQNLDSHDALILASALYFKGAWTYKFDKSKSAKKSFTADGGKSFQTPMMHEDFDHEFQVMGQDRAGYEAVSLTYGAEDARSMRLVLVRPKDPAVTARGWLSKETENTSPDWFDASKFEDVRGSVELPHLDIKQHHDLIPALEDIGITSAFSGNSNFASMADVKGPKLAISHVSHDVVFKTDEEGSEAAAVTTIALAGAAMMKPPRHIDIKFDRSFVFALQDARTGTVLFLGAVNKPNAEMTAQ